jgi:hypothetical protein
MTEITTKATTRAKVLAMKNHTTEKVGIHTELSEVAVEVITAATIKIEITMLTVIKKVMVMDKTNNRLLHTEVAEAAVEVEEVTEPTEVVITIIKTKNNNIK